MHPNQITQWKAELLDRAPEVFAGAAVKREQGPDLKLLQAKIGQQALEIDLLEGALGRVGDVHDLPTGRWGRGERTRA